MSKFTRYYQIFYQTVFAFLHSHANHVRMIPSSYTYRYWYKHIFFFFCQIDGLEIVSRCFNLHFPDHGEADYLLIYLLTNGQSMVMVSI